MLPAERATLQQPDQRVAGIAEEAEHDGRAQHLRDQEEIAPVVDEIAEAVLGADELRDHDDEERQRQPEAHAREDLGERRWQQDAEEELTRPGPEALGRAHEERIDPADGVDGGEEHREERRVRDEADLGLLADANPYDEERQHREWRDRAQQLDDRLDGTPNGTEVAGGKTDGEREHGAGAEAQGDALKGGA